MKKIIVTIMIIFGILANPSTFASEEGLDIITSDCSEIKIVKTYGNGKPGLGSVFRDCNYTTRDVNEINSIVNFINSMEIKQNNINHGCSDTPRLHVYIDDDLKLSFDIRCGVCYINGKCYAIDKAVYDDFIGMVYEFKDNKGIEITYYNSGNYGEFPSCLKTGYYTYVTTDKAEIEAIQECIANIKFIPFNGGFAGNGGERLTVCADDGKVLDFYLTDTVDGKWRCYYDGACYFYSIDECRKLEELVFGYKAKDEVKVYLNNQRIKFYNSPIVVNNRVLAPAENIAKALELNVSEKNKNIYFKKDNRFCEFIPEKYSVNENGSPRSIDAGCQIINGIAMVPVRALAEYYGFTVKWENNSVYIISK